jgi:hypothetical protein
MVFTYGLVASELLDAVERGPSHRLFDRVGWPWLIDLDRALRPPAQDPEEHEAFLPNFGDPWQPPSPALDDRAALPDAVPDWVVANFANSRAWARVRDWTQHYLGRFASDIGPATSTQDPTPSLLAEALEFPGELRVQPSRLVSRRGGHEWSFRPSDLWSRVALELIELYATRPRVRRCLLCRGAFIPVEREANCRWGLWIVGTNKPLREVCDPEAFETFLAREASEDLEHKRTRTRLSQTHRRRSRDFGPDHWRTIQARKAWENYMLANPRKRGPKQKAMAATVETQMPTPATG